MDSFAHLSTLLELCPNLKAKRDQIVLGVVHQIFADFFGVTRQIIRERSRGYGSQERNRIGPVRPCTRTDLAPRNLKPREPSVKFRSSGRDEGPMTYVVRAIPVFETPLVLPQKR